MRMEAAVYEDIIDSLRSRSWGDLDLLQEEICQEFPETEAQSIRSILCQESDADLKSFVVLKSDIITGISASCEANIQWQ